MNNIVIINAMNLSEYAWHEIYEGKNSVQFAVSAANQMAEVSSRAVILPPGKKYDGYFDSFKEYEKEPEDVAALITALIEVSEGYDNIFYYFADCPLVDIPLTEKMYANHKKYFCEYTFADGYPMGISVEIIKTSILPMLLKIAEGSDVAPDRKAVFSLIEKDINSFELETEISPDDQRLLRVALYPDTKRNYLQLKSVTEAVKKAGTGVKGENTAVNILDVVRSHGELLRSLPIFYEFETTSAHQQKISYMPQPWNSGDINRMKEMPFESFRNALKKVSGFSEDAVISLSIRNEPSLHSRVADLAQEVLNYDKFSLLIETSGTGWDEGALTRILDMDKNRISWIIDLDALDEGFYKRLRGDGYKEAYNFAERLLTLSPENLWVQVVRMKENEEDTELFYKYWKEKTNNVIIQKYDWCCGRLEQRKVTDLSPVKRLPCWSLKRSMAVLNDGSVPICRDDLEKELICGNIFTDDPAEIWKNGSAFYQQHLDEEYPVLCGKCDEYYTYNY